MLFHVALCLSIGLLFLYPSLLLLDPSRRPRNEALVPLRIVYRPKVGRQGEKEKDNVENDNGDGDTMLLLAPVQEVDCTKSQLTDPFPRAAVGA